MPSVHEVLLATGFSEAEIAQMDQRATTAFSTILSNAEAERQQAQLERQSNVQFYEEKVMPGLLSFDQERQELEAAKTKAEREAQYLRAAAQAAGILPEEVTRDPNGRFVAGGGNTPGSPTFLDPNQVAARIGDVAGVLTDIQWKYQTLFGSPLPVNPSKLIQEADAVGQDPASYAARKFRFAEREQELAAKRQQEHDEAIKKAAAAERDRYWSERGGSNPDLRQAQTARMSEVRAAVKAGDVKDPLKMTDAERRAQSRKMIHKEIAEKAEAS